jgi:hypothetical protein
MYFFLTFLASISGVAYYWDCDPKPVKSFWGKLKTYAGITYEVYKYRLCQAMNYSVKHIDRKNAVVTYTVNGKLFKFFVKTFNGPSPVKAIFSGDKDITTEISPFMGPSYDWHGRTFFPKDFGYDSMDFFMEEDSDVRKKSFEKDEPILLYV